MNATSSDITFRRYLFNALTLALLAMLVLLVDSRLAIAFRDGLLPGDLRRLVSLSEVFAHGLGVAAILAVIWVVAVSARRKMLRVAACAFVPGITVALLKTFVGRDRPSSLKEIPANITETFHGFFPAISQSDYGLLFERSLQSCPSGHSATAVGLAIGLTWLMPRGKWCFATFALLAMCQRMQSGAHFPSDTILAAAIAMVVAGSFVARTPGSERFARFESKHDFQVYGEESQGKLTEKSKSAA